MRRLLVVDDDPHISFAFRAWLKRRGFRVAIADGGGTGLAAPDDAAFDLMVADVFMPGMGGFESSEAEPHRRCVTRLAAAASAVSEPAENIDHRTRFAGGFTA
jgi:CheY-like chemotaxis protein